MTSQSRRRERDERDAMEEDAGQQMVDVPTTHGAEGDRSSSSSSLASSSSSIASSTVLIGAGGILFAVLLRSSVLNLLLVPLCAAFMLLNPWVRMFLDLEPMDEDAHDAKRFSTFDPARLVLTLKGRTGEAGGGGGGEVTDEQDGGKTKETKHVAATTARLDRSGAYAALRRMPASLRKPLSDLEELIIRDCICSWYNYHSFGEPSFPNEARFSIDHAIGSLFHAIEPLKSADMTSELLLAAASVLLVTLRYRRLHPKRAAIFVNDQQRIQALREALDRVFLRHVSRQDAQCDLLRTLLREIISKQLWNAICGVGEPDFINQQIVQWHERNAETTSNPEQHQQQPYPVRQPTATSSTASSIQQHHHQQQPPPQQQQQQQPQYDPSLQQASLLSSPLSSTPERRDSPEHYRSDEGISTGRASAASSERSAGPSVTTSSLATSRPAPLNLPSELRTTQPKAMMMPSPLTRSATSSSTTASSTLAVTSPLERMASPFSGSAASVSSNGSQVNASRQFPFEQTLIQSRQSPHSTPSSAPKGHTRTISASSSNGSKTSSTIPRAADVSDATLAAWDNVMPMNVPPTAHEGMKLPDSLRKSMKGITSRPTSSEGSEGGRSHDGYVIEGRRSSNETDRLDGERTEKGRPVAIQSGLPAISDASASSSNTAVDSATPAPKPPSRVPSSASGGIPPAPDMAEVLSNKPSSAVFVGLRDAFESFLERGGAVNRSLFFSPPSAATVAPGEGEALLKLHVGLLAIARLMPAGEGQSSEQADEVYRDDAANILQKGLQALAEADDGGVAGRQLRETLFFALRRLDSSSPTESVREIVQPVERALWSRLYGLYEHFWKETCTRPSGGRPAFSSTASGSSTPARESFSPEPMSGNGWSKRSSREIRSSVEAGRSGQGSTAVGAGELHYEPRRKAMTSMSPAAKQTKLPSAAQSPSGSPIKQQLRSLPSENSSPTLPKERGLRKPSPRRAQPSSPPIVRHRSDPPQSKSAAGFEVTVTDVSVNAEHPTMPVDPRTYEVMIAVEGLTSDAGGFVLLRHWKDFQQLIEEIERTASLPSLRVPLPDPKGKGSAALTSQVQVFLQQLLTSPLHMTSDAVQYFVDKARAGEDVSTDRMGVLLEGLQLGKGLDFGRTLASGVVNTLQKGTRAAVNRAAMFPVPVSLGEMPSNSETLTSPASMEKKSSSSRPASTTLEKQAQQADSAVDTATAPSLDDEPDVVGPRLAHLPIGVRKSYGGRKEWEEEGLGISSDDAPHDSRNIRSPPAMHRRTQSNEQRSPKLVPPPLPGRMPTAPGNSFGLDKAGQRHDEAADSERMRGTPSVPSEMSQDDLDNLLSCLFAIADEAFNLSGGWTFRRGMLRVFEQIVRTQYWTSILGLFNNIAQSLNHEQLGSWCTEAKAKFWPDEMKKGADGLTNKNDEMTENMTSADALGDAVVEAAKEAATSSSSSPPMSQPQPSMPQTAASTNGQAPNTRSVAQRLFTHRRAQAILLSRIPSSSAIFMGPGGRQSCERALICLHEEICQPSTSLDLVLTVVLKLCDIAAR